MMQLTMMMYWHANAFHIIGPLLKPEQNVNHFVDDIYFQCIFLVDNISIFITILNANCSLIFNWNNIGWGISMAPVGAFTNMD